jgi:hypothetical protein
LSVYVLFNEAIVNSDYIALNDLMTANDELDRIWKEAAVAYSRAVVFNLGYAKTS